jgi:hypothetical protein
LGDTERLGRNPTIARHPSLRASWLNSLKARFLSRMEHIDEPISQGTRDLRGSRVGQITGKSRYVGSAAGRGPGGSFEDTGRARRIPLQKTRHASIESESVRRPRRNAHPRRFHWSAVEPKLFIKNVRKRGPQNVEDMLASWLFSPVTLSRDDSFPPTSLQGLIPKSCLTKAIFKSQSFQKRYHLGAQSCGLRFDYRVFAIFNCSTANLRARDQASG